MHRSFYSVIYNSVLQVLLKWNRGSFTALQLTQPTLVGTTTLKYKKTISTQISREIFSNTMLTLWTKSFWKVDRYFFSLFLCEAECCWMARHIFRFSSSYKISNTRLDQGKILINCAHCILVYSHWCVMCKPMSRTTARPDTTDRMVIRIRFDYQQNIHISMYLEEQLISRLLLVNIFH